jgi:hypothetical protein
MRSRPRLQSRLWTTQLSAGGEENGAARRTSVSLSPTLRQALSCGEAY